MSCRFAARSPFCALISGSWDDAFRKDADISSGSCIQPLQPSPGKRLGNRDGFRACIFQRWKENASSIVARSRGEYARSHFSPSRHPSLRMKRSVVLTKRRVCSPAIATPHRTHGLRPHGGPPVRATTTPELSDLIKLGPGNGYCVCGTGGLQVNSASSRRPQLESFEVFGGSIFIETTIPDGQYFFRLHPSRPSAVLGPSISQRLKAKWFLIACSHFHADGEGCRGCRTGRTRLRPDPAHGTG